MDSKTLLLAITLVTIIFYHQVNAEIESRRRDNEVVRCDVLEQMFKVINGDDKKMKKGTDSEFYYNYVYPKTPEELEERGLKCIPGRTVIRITEKEPEPITAPTSSAEDDYRVKRSSSRRSHMNTGRKEEYCKVCTCSVEGKDEYCSGRPAVNVNECLRMSLIIEEFNRNDAYDHTRGLPFRIRRDYIWHDDEIPYEPKMKCRRGHAYYTNNVNANDTDIDISSDVESLLDYPNQDICQYCVCAVHGHGVDCINRDLWFCHYYRYLRMKDSARDRYHRLFQQDRPTYFRQLSWRMRRTMDDGIYDFVETVGSPRDQKCIPFVSEYTDCTDENSCTGCQSCVCVGKGEWSCERVTQCPEDERFHTVDEDSIDDALEHIERGLEEELRREKANSKSPLVPGPIRKANEALLEEFFPGQENIDVEIIKYLTRKKRSTDISNKTEEKIKFYHTLDEIDEDILKHDNASGTIQARKFANLPKASRRTGISDNDSLHIEFTEPKVYDAHITDNKIDLIGHTEDKYVKQENDKINALIRNHTTKQKDKELSKIIVNELKNGTEVIGDRDAPVMSNITFTSENDTLTAMAFIAGNLLNQLWNMEKASSEETKDTEDLKHEKIADLLDLFKEPLNIRQENFLKNALEQLSVAIDKDKLLQNTSVCEKIEESRRRVEEELNESSPYMTSETITMKQEKPKIVEEVPKVQEAPNDEAASQAISKIGDVLSLIHKFQQVHKSLIGLRHTKKYVKTSSEAPRKNTKLPTKKPILTNDETDSLNVFGKVLEKITKLLIPHKKSKKIVKTIQNQQLYAKSSDIARTIKSKLGIDIGNITLTAKDKMILDYLNTVQRHPNCILHNAQEESKPFSNVEGSILLNLSEFFKIKSFVDLLKLVDSDKPNFRTQSDETSPQNTTPSTTTSEAATTTPHSIKLAQTKERLKDHIKSIIDDLRELQLAKGFPASNISIADTLPCIYNILNADNGIQDKTTKNKEDKISPIEKVSAIFNSIKTEILAAPSRRTNVISKPRPKSVAVWERIIKSFDGKKQRTRRMMEQPKSYDDIKKMMKVLQQTSNTYKNQVLSKGVKPVYRLALLKTLLEETRKYVQVLENIEELLVNSKQLSLEKQNNLKNFVYNAAMNINLNSKVAKNSNKYLGENIKGDVEIITPKKEKPLKEYSIQKQPLRSLNIPASKKSIKLTRDEIINQLIKNRMEVYIKVKEAKKRDLSNDITYDIAKKILTYLEMGNYNLARELYKYLINQKEETKDNLKEFTTAPPLNKNLYGYPKEPLIQFVEPTTQNQWSGHNAWLKQLINLKKI